MKTSGPNKFAGRCGDCRRPVAAGAGRWVLTPQGVARTKIVCLSCDPNAREYVPSLPGEIHNALGEMFSADPEDFVQKIDGQWCLVLPWDWVEALVSGIRKEVSNVRDQ